MDTPTPLQTAPTPPHPDAAAVRAELDAALADSLRRATTRAEQIRLTRIHGLVEALYGSPAA
jgi:hypothetical protein